MEKWKAIPNTRYEVSSEGRVRSLERAIKISDGRVRHYKGHLLKGRNRHGYFNVQLGRGCEKPIHRLVAEHFLENPNGYNCINHKDGNKHNNNVENLEWCNYTQNLVHAYDTKLNPRQKEVVQLSLDGEIIRKWKSGMECERELGFDHRKISRCCNGLAKTHQGYRWAFN